MQRERVRHPRALIAVLIVGGAGLGLLAVGVTTPAGWTLIGPGFAAVIASLVIAGWLQAPQIKANTRPPRPPPHR